MPSSPLDGKHGRTTSGVACKHRLWEAQMVGRRRTWHAIIAFGQHTQSNEVGRGMPSSPLGSTHCRTMSGLTCHHRLWTSLHSWISLGVACHHRPWTANTIKRRQAWHAIIAFRQHKRSNNVGRGMPSSPLGSTNDRTTSGVACHHRHCEAHTVK